MPFYGTQSEWYLSSVSPDLQRVLRTVIQMKDHSVLCGHRGIEEQHAAFLKGNSKVDWPNSLHNENPSRAVDIWAYDTLHQRLFPWDAIEEQAILAGMILSAAYLLDIPIRWGHDWNNNAIVSDEGKSLVDRPHFELRSSY